MAPGLRSLAAEAPLLLAALALALVPSFAWAALATAAAGLLWLGLRRPPWREVAVTGSAVAITVVLLLLGWRMEELRHGDPAHWERQAEVPWLELWRTLEVEGREGRERLLSAMGSSPQRLPTPAALAEMAAGEARQKAFQELGGTTDGVTLLLVDSAGSVVAWAGPGLLHELEGRDLPLEGYTFRASFAKTSLLVVLPTSSGTLPWRLVAARTLAADRLPFIAPGGDGSHWRWSVISPAESQTSSRGSQSFDSATSISSAEAAAGDAYVVTPAADRGEGLGKVPALLAWRAQPATPPLGPRRGAAFVLGVGLLGLAVLRGVGRWVGPSLWSNASLVMLTLAGVAAGSLAVTGSAMLAGLLLAGLGWCAASLFSTSVAVEEEGDGQIEVAPASSSRREPAARGDGFLGVFAAVAMLGGAGLFALAWAAFTVAPWIPPSSRSWRLATTTLDSSAELPFDIGSGLFDSPAAVVLRLALALAVLGLLLTTVRWLRRWLAPPWREEGRERGPSRFSDGKASGGKARAGKTSGVRRSRFALAVLRPTVAALGAVTLAILAAALSPILWAALPILALAFAFAAFWGAGRDVGREEEGASWSALPIALLLVTVLSAAAWETVYQSQQLRTARGEILPGLALPSEELQTDLRRDVDDYFQTLDLGTLMPRPLEGLQTQDLAYRVWRDSPLARRNTVSALVLQPDLARPALFAFGYSASVRPPRALVDGGLTGLGPWDRLEFRGEQVVSLDGVRWGLVHYWVRPRPGFVLDSSRRGGGLALDLLQGETAVGGRVEGLPPRAIYALYDADGFPLVKPWDEAPPLTPLLRASPPGTGGTTNEAVSGATSGESKVSTPLGQARAFARSDGEVTTVLYLPRPTILESLDRVGSHALGSLLVLTLFALLALGLALPRQGFRELLGRGLRTYSTRLLVAYTVFLLVPLPLINIALLQGVKDRLQRQQRDSGEAALAAAQRYVGDFTADLRAGIAVEASTFETALGDLAALVSHDVNLYWGGVETEIASSRPELFTAGLLPKRMPGPVYSRLVLERYNQSSRTNEVDGVPYLELYAPVSLPGASAAAPPQLFVSLPLLAQEQELAAQLGGLRRQSFLITALLFTLLMTLSARLARGFAAPITELVAGTRRIAQGEASLEVEPRDLELADLARAIDEMARRIDQGRRRLLREKHVVERIVEHITSGVVSLDAEGRVLMGNRVAQDMLGVEVGESLHRALSAHGSSETAGASRQASIEVPGAERVSAVESSAIAPLAVDPSVIQPVAEPPMEAEGEADGSLDLAPIGRFLSTVRRAPRRPHQATVNLLPADGGEGQEWSLIWVPVPGDGEPSALLVVEDATEVLRSQRLQAWAEMARIIAHEIKNPLTPIRLSAEHMSLVKQESPEQFDAVFERCVHNILRQVEELREIATEFSTYSSILTIEPSRGDLVAAARELVESYRAAPPPGVEVRFESDLDELETRFDDRLMSRAVRNLMENAVRASGDGGDVVLRVALQGEEIALIVQDTGPGVEADHLPRIFDPYFSTHDSGTGLGLPIARRVVEAHGGSLSARNRSRRGLEVTITIPR
ncbi:MAG: ATP-binding protein [Acidobacteriota bacterium]